MISPYCHEELMNIDINYAKGYLEAQLKFTRHMLNRVIDEVAYNTLEDWYNIQRRLERGCSTDLCGGFIDSHPYKERSND